MRILDISPTISPDLAVWPGDVPYASQKALRIADGANLDLGSMQTTYHVGAHADAPSHYVEGGADAASMDLERFYGDCQVVDVDVDPGQRITPDDMGPDVAASRLLLKTGTFPDPTHWNEDFAALAPELVDHLGALGVRLVGIDTPSVDLMHDKQLLAHKRLAANGMVNLEGLVLDHVAPGRYTLAALPLKLHDADGSPVRAVLLDG